MRVRHVERNARRLLTVDVTSERTKWSGHLEGAIVRLRPIEWIDPNELAQIVSGVSDYGAFVVKVMPCPPKGEVVVTDTERQQRRSLREVVAEMVDQAKGIDTDALRDMVEGIMETEGL